jgi:hypothetical protein
MVDRAGVLELSGQYVSGSKNTSGEEEQRNLCGKGRGNRR